MISKFNSSSRRHFLKGTAAAGALALTTNARSYGRIIGANEAVRMGVVGFRSRGRSLIGAINAAAGANLVALCDADEKVLADYDTGNADLFRTSDLREMLGRKDVDAIASATPNHWHALVTCWACDAGKHVYIEKPISHNMLESQKIVEAARRNDVLVQGGFQNRSDTGLLPFFENLRSGKYGEVLAVHGTCHRQRASIGKLEKPLMIPKQINFDMWLGPAADQPIMRPSLHYDWHWDFNTGNGDVGNQGPHEWDMMNWALGDPLNLPGEMIAAGNRFGWSDAGDTPNVMACSGVSNDIPFCFEVMDLKGGRRAPFGRGVGVIIETEKGRFVGGRGGGNFIFHDGQTEKFRRDETQAKSDGTPAHMANFVTAVQQRDKSGLRSECAVAANSSAMAHMANISFQLASEEPVEKMEAAFSGDLRQRDMLARLRESAMLFALQQEENTQLEAWLLGQRLQFDPQANQFVGTKASRANALMTRDYRKGFEI
ncbi:MAG: Gfo/Idh/MocA family oxidoreductase [Pirellulaceae bacterium]|nr:Gfo/Idh/MocA family oxidoreductase [Pirellulaceae bacterium]